MKNSKCSFKPYNFSIINLTNVKSISFFLFVNWKRTKCPLIQSIISVGNMRNWRHTLWNVQLWESSIQAKQRRKEIIHVRRKNHSFRILKTEDFRDMLLKKNQSLTKIQLLMIESYSWPEFVTDHWEWV